MVNRKILGFTLVEILVVVVIFSIIGLGIATSFLSGIKIWRRAQDMASDNDLILTLERVSSELHQSVTIPDIEFEVKSENVGGKKAWELSFPALIDNSIVKITYKFNPDNKVLLRGEICLKDILSGKEKERYAEKKVLSLGESFINCLGLDEESKTYIWQDFWKEEGKIFYLIKLYGKYNGKEFNKIIFIPIS